MKPERSFIAERALAQHCPELLTRGPKPADLLAQFARVGERLARLLAAGLAPLMGGKAPAVRCRPAEDVDATALAAVIAPLAANFLFGMGDGDARIFASFHAEGVLRLVDRAFGGSGEAPSPLPEQFPLSCDLMMQRLEMLAAQALATSLAVESAIQPLARSDRFPDLPGFAPDARVAILPLEVTQSDGATWTIAVAAPLAALGSLFGQGEARQGARTIPGSSTGEPFGDLPLPLRAVLVDMRMAVSALSELRPGQVLPVSVARSVPLRIGETTVAHGTVGALDDRVALQLTQAF